jgi:hypothetical protein
MGDSLQFQDRHPPVLLSETLRSIMNALWYINNEKIHEYEYLQTNTVLN